MQSSTSGSAVLRTACDRCHTQKLKCVRPIRNLGEPSEPSVSSSHDTSPCERCRRANAVCTYSSPMRSHAHQKARPAAQTNLYAPGWHKSPDVRLPHWMVAPDMGDVAGSGELHADVRKALDSHSSCTVGAANVTENAQAKERKQTSEPDQVVHEIPRIPFRSTENGTDMVRRMWLAPQSGLQGNDGSNGSNASGSTSSAMSVSTTDSKARFHYPDLGAYNYSKPATGPMYMHYDWSCGDIPDGALDVLSLAEPTNDTIDQVESRQSAELSKLFDEIMASPKAEDLLSNGDTVAAPVDSNMFDGNEQYTGAATTSSAPKNHLEVMQELSIINLELMGFDQSPRHTKQVPNQPQKFAMDDLFRLSARLLTAILASISDAIVEHMGKESLVPMILFMNSVVVQHTRLYMSVYEQLSSAFKPEQSGNLPLLQSHPLEFGAPNWHDVVAHSERVILLVDEAYLDAKTKYRGAAASSSNGEGADVSSKWYHELCGKLLQKIQAVKDLVEASGR